MIYIIVLIVLLLGFILFDVNRYKDHHNFYLYFEWLILVMLAGFRYKVGGDTIIYYNSFQNQPSLSELGTYDFSTSKYNILWFYFTGLCKLIYDDFFVVQIIHAIIVNTAFFSFFKKYAKYYFSAILLYFLMYYFTYNTEIMRASLCVSIFLYGFDYFKKRKWIRYCIIAVFAMGIHLEALVMFILPVVFVLSKIRTNLVNIIIFVLFCILTSFINIIPYLQSIFVLSQQMSFVFDIYSQQTIHINVFGYVMYIILMLPWLFYLWISKHEKNNILKGFILLYVFISFQAIHYSVFMSRVCDFLYPFTILALIKSVQIVKIRREVVLNIIMFFLFFISIGHRMNSYISNNHWLLFYPYSSIFDPQENEIRESLIYDIQNSNL